jgi:translation elongation factor EF-Tu-like GTPase
MTRLFKVEDVFEIPERGCVILPRIPAELDFKIRVKDQIQLRTPDGRVFDTQIAAIEFADGRKEDGSKSSRMAIMLPRNITKEDVPSGTEVWAL